MSSVPHGTRWSHTYRPCFIIFLFGLLSARSCFESACAGVSVSSELAAADRLPCACLSLFYSSKISRSVLPLGPPSLPSSSFFFANDLYACVPMSDYDVLSVVIVNWDVLGLTWDIQNERSSACPPWNFCA